MSYGEPAARPDVGRVVEVASEVVNKAGIIFVASAGNAGEGLGTVPASGLHHAPAPVTQVQGRRAAPSLPALCTTVGSCQRLLHAGVSRWPHLVCSGKVAPWGLWHEVVFRSPPLTTQLVTLLLLLLLPLLLRVRPSQALRSAPWVLQAAPQVRCWASAPMSAPSWLPQGTA